MLFDLADPFRDPSLVWLCTLLVTLCFIVDYLHLSLNLLPDGRAEHAFQPFLDILIALLFCVSYFCLARINELPNEQTGNIVKDNAVLNATASLFLILIAQALILIYDSLLEEVDGLIDYLPIIFSLLGTVMMVSIGNDDNVFWLTAIFILSILFSYIFRIVHIDLRKKE